MLPHLNIQRFCLVVLMFLPGVTPSIFGQEHLAQTAPEWNRVFETTSGWVGGDGGGSIDLGKGRVLWLFGDSLIGEIKDGKYVSGTHMVNNAIAVGEFSRTDPAPMNPEFVWGENNSHGKPVAWLVPDPESVKPSATKMHEEHPHGWFWPAGGGCLIQCDDGSDKLVVFLFHIGRTLKDQGVWSFKNVGGAVAVIDNPDAPVSEWKIRQLDFPYTIGTDAARNNTELCETTWGMSCLSVPSASDRESRSWIYVYGTRMLKNGQRQVLVARAAPSKLETFDTWEFFSGTAQKPMWSSNPEDASSIAEHGVSEFSVEAFEHRGQPKYVMVQSDPGLGGKTYVRVSDSPLGPWNNGAAIYEAPELSKSKNYFAYAAKGHKSLSADGKLLVTYVVNSTDFWEMLGDGSIYRPRCLSISLNELFDTAVPENN